MRRFTSTGAIRLDGDEAAWLLSQADGWDKVITIGFGGRLLLLPHPSNEWAREALTARWASEVTA